MPGRLVLWAALALSSLSSALSWLAQRYLLRTPAHGWRAVWVLTNLSFVASTLLVTATAVLGSPRMRGDTRDTVRAMRREPGWLSGAALVGVPLFITAFGLLTTYALSRSHVSFFGPTRTLVGQLLLVLGAWVLLREKVSPWMLCGVACLFAGLGFMIAHTVVTKNGFIDH